MRSESEVPLQAPPSTAQNEFTEVKVTLCQPLCNTHAASCGSSDLGSIPLKTIWAFARSEHSISHCDLDKSITLRSLFGTDTQRGVLTGLSRERNLRSKIWWFTEFCNSHYVSHFAAFFIVTGTKISVAKSCFSFVFLTLESSQD